MPSVGAQQVEGGGTAPTATAFPAPFRQKSILTLNAEG